MVEQPGDVFFDPARCAGWPTQHSENSPEEQGDGCETTEGKLYDRNKDGEPNGLGEPRVWRPRCRAALRWRWSCVHRDYVPLCHWGNFSAMRVAAGLSSAWSGR